MNAPRALVLRAPGINCDRETAQACRLVGFATDLLHINTLLNAPDLLLDYDFLVIPGGFSYGDDLGAGTLLAKNLTIHIGGQLQQFIEQGRLLLGICNGFQVLVRAGLLPGPLSNQDITDNLSNNDYRNDVVDELSGPFASPSLHSGLRLTEGDIACGARLNTFAPKDQSRATLTENASAQFECSWVTLSTQPGPCIFTKGIIHPIELPIAHGEGRFILADPILSSQLQAQGQIPLIYSEPRAQMREMNLDPPYERDESRPLDSPQSRTHNDSSPLQDPLHNTESSLAEIPYPYNPNGSMGNIAGICNAQGNVFGLMPHPERYVHALQHPQRYSRVNGQGDGLLIFKNAYEHSKTLNGQSWIGTGINEEKLT